MVKMLKKLSQRLREANTKNDEGASVEALIPELEAMEEELYIKLKELDYRLTKLEGVQNEELLDPSFEDVITENGEIKRKWLK
jgi:hypothetical protein